jgi:hypothetical protein
MNNLPDHIQEALEEWERRSIEEEFGPAPEPEYEPLPE